MPKWEQPVLRARDVIATIQEEVGPNHELSVRIGGGKILKVEVPKASDKVFENIMVKLRTKYPAAW